MPKEPLYVTRPSLPPLDEFLPYLRDIWRSGWVTNMARYHGELEQALAAYLDVPHVSLFCNGTVALQVGLQALRVRGEVITTPYSFPATSHSILWNHSRPVFCDVEPDTLNLDPARVEEAVTPETTAILAVHVYGNPCRAEPLADLARRRGLRLFFDAAHAFGVRQDGRPVAGLGDLAMISFHATKVFHTLEGGALVTHDPELKQRIDYLKNFGFADEVTVVAPGCNGKMNEVQAALGLLQLRRVDACIARRRAAAARYTERLGGVPGLRLPAPPPGVEGNGSYYPVLVDAAAFGRTRDELYDDLRGAGIHGRRYFYPLISRFPCYRDLPSARPGNLPVAEDAARRVLCLPLYDGLGDAGVDRVCDAVRASRARATGKRTGRPR